MKKYIFHVIIFLITISSLTVIAQTRIENEILIEFENEINTKSFMLQLRRNIDISGNIDIENICSEPKIIKKISFDSRSSAFVAIQYLKNNSNIKNIQYNHKIENREVPDDSLFYSQWHLNNTGQGGGFVNADIDADLAWDLSTNGFTYAGDTIVICVVDDGCDIFHEDIISNIWINKNEIPDNGIDDDGDSFIDNYYGYNTETENGDIPSGSHGTSVCGLIGATGNNHIGITGVNQNIKIMPVFYGDDDAHTIAAYSYIYKMRKLYNETNGGKGAFIVATNSSFGIDNAYASDYPIWCGMYDALGSVGILNIVATTNNNTDVDFFGDMPSTCPSNYLLAVTNMNRYDNKVTSAGYGIENIDVGAYGESVLTIKPNNRYVSFNGTSAATPVATGIVGLIYSYGEKLAEIARLKPENAPLMVKDALIKGVKQNSSLQNITSTGGVVNAFNSMKQIKIYDSICSPPAIINIENIKPNSVIISWENEDIVYYNLELTNLISGDKEYFQNLVDSIELNGLFACRDYEIKLQKKCNINLSDFGYPMYFKTDGCCTSPVISEYNLFGDSISFSWNKITAATEYTVMTKLWADPVWDTITTFENHFNLNFPFECGEVIAQIKSNCEEIISPEEHITTIGNSCPDCSENTYCYPFIENGFECISNVKIGNFSHSSGFEYYGYGQFNQSKSLKLISGKEYDVEIDLEFSDIIYDDTLYIWIDLNNDGKFNENELVGTGSNDNYKTIKTKINIPELEYIGTSTMRILLSAFSISDPCEISDIHYGEYEDYCIVLDTVETCTFDDLEINTTVSNDNLKFSWVEDGNAYKYLFSLANATSGVNIFFDFDNVSSISYFGLDTCELYNFSLVKYCNSYDYTEVLSKPVSTLCGSAISEPEKTIFEIFPNPFSNFIELDNHYSNNYDVTIYNDIGQNLVSKNNLNGNYIIQLEKLKSGIYYIAIQTGKEVFVHKIIKI